MRIWLAVALLPLSGLVPEPVHSAAWLAQAGPESRLEFVASWEGNPIPGEFKKFSARVVFEAESLRGEMRVTVDTSSVTTGMPDVDEALALPEWFSLARFPQAEFSADRFRRLADGGFSAQGSLTLKGVRLALEVPFRWDEGAQDARLWGKLVIDRRDFEIGSGEWSSGEIIGTEVSVEFDLRLLPGSDAAP